MDWLIPYLPGFVAAFSIQAFSVLSPGPAVAFLLGTALSQGRSFAIAGSFGIAFAAVTIALLTTQGLGLLMERIAWLSTVIRAVGICYLLWLAAKAWGRAFAPPSIKIADVSYGTSHLRAVLAGYLMHTTNPKAIIFWLAIASASGMEGATVTSPYGLYYRSVPSFVNRPYHLRRSAVIPPLPISL